MKLRLILIVSLFVFQLKAQEILPPALEWHGKSEELILPNSDKWVTPFESHGFNFSPDYEQTMSWFKKLAKKSALISYHVIGKSPQGRDIVMIIASKDKAFHKGKVNRDKSILLIQAGIHSGEIDGKDAGMMLLRDIAFNGKSDLLNENNFLFIPILSVDGHEKSSEFGRPNQRGPEKMGWRTNSNNLNLNRDYTKLETPGVIAVINQINKYNPDLYIDVHVTDGADYQYDLTYGFNRHVTKSKSVNSWLRNTYRVEVDKELQNQGHIPGPFINPYKAADFSVGVMDYNLGARFSNGYGDIRHTPSILLENHSLKPYKQRVLGTYIFMEQTIKTLSKNYKELRTLVQKDSKNPSSIALEFTASGETKDTIDFLGVKSQIVHSDLLGLDYVKWMGEKDVTKKLPYYAPDTPKNIVDVPRYYYVPAEWQEIIEKIKLHGLEFEVLKEDQTMELTYYKVVDYKMPRAPYEGRVGVTNYKLEKLKVKRVLKAGSLKIRTDQKLGILAVYLLDSHSQDSFFAWGYMNSVLSRTEYIEGYVLAPLAEKMIAENPQLKEEFDKAIEENPRLKSSPYGMYTWFYERSNYFDKDWKIIPIGMEE